MKISNTEAVSPVVGVMLMLVVTIIIAAVVSAFAGGMHTSTEKAPQLTISCKYSQSEGLSISHNGGDAVGTRTAEIYLRNGKSFGSGGYQQFKLNKSQISEVTGKTYWVTSSGMSGVKTLAGGDTAYLYPPYHECQWLQPLIKCSAYSSYNSTQNIGKDIVVEMSDENGHVFAKTQCPITK
ncbi:MAG: type IV pilin N-terminal domain-containing protein [Methanoregula sp.]|nr:type IV pilin N-terminal domain-containing protein [Methanoregula sp.]